MTMLGRGLRVDPGQRSAKNERSWAGPQDLSFSVVRRFPGNRPWSARCDGAAIGCVRAEDVWRGGRGGRVGVRGIDF